MTRSLKTVMLANVMKNIIRKVIGIKKIQELKISLSKIFYLSLGENCLTDDILKRHNIKSFSTPYASARSNIDYIIQLETMDYRFLLNNDYLEYGTAGKDKVIRSKLITNCMNIYANWHMKGLEFSHHDIIAKEEEKDKIRRRIKRMRKYRGKKTMIFFYHYRFNTNMNLEMLFKKMEILLNI